MNGPQFYEYATPADLADAREEELGQSGSHHRRLAEPRFGQRRGLVETVAVSAAVLALVLLGIAHRSPQGADRGASVEKVATATPDPSRVVTCMIAHGRPATDEPAGVDRGSRQTGTAPHNCPTEQWRAAQSAYLARLLAQQASATAAPAATRTHS